MLLELVICAAADSSDTEEAHDEAGIFLCDVGEHKASISGVMAKPSLSPNPTQIAYSVQGYTLMLLEEALRDVGALLPDTGLVMADMQPNEKTAHPKRAQKYVSMSILQRN